MFDVMVRLILNTKTLNWEFCFIVGAKKKARWNQHLMFSTRPTIDRVPSIDIQSWDHHLLKSLVWFHLPVTKRAVVKAATP
jgi:hypothetical protein